MVVVGSGVSVAETMECNGGSGICIVKQLANIEKFKLCNVLFDWMGHCQLWMVLLITDDSLLHFLLLY